MNKRQIKKSLVYHVRMCRHLILDCQYYKNKYMSQKRLNNQIIKMNKDTEEKVSFCVGEFKKIKEAHEELLKKYNELKEETK